jgi:hypothetical protein
MVDIEETGQPGIANQYILRATIFSYGLRESTIISTAKSVLDIHHQLSSQPT